MNINPNPESSLSQTKRIYNYLMDGARITPLKALAKFSSFRLGARIADIKERYNVEIQSRYITLANGKRVKEYWIEKRTLN